MLKNLILAVTATLFIGPATSAWASDSGSIVGAWEATVEDSSDETVDDSAGNEAAAGNPGEPTQLKKAIDKLGPDSVKNHMVVIDRSNQVFSILPLSSLDSLYGDISASDIFRFAGKVVGGRLVPSTDQGQTIISFSINPKGQLVLMQRDSTSSESFVTTYNRVANDLANKQYRKNSAIAKLLNARAAEVSRALLAGAFDLSGVRINNQKSKIQDVMTLLAESDSEGDADLPAYIQARANNVIFIGEASEAGEDHAGFYEVTFDLMTLATNLRVFDLSPYSQKEGVPTEESSFKETSYRIDSMGNGTITLAQDLFPKNMDRYSSEPISTIQLNFKLRSKK